MPDLKIQETLGELIFGISDMRFGQIKTKKFAAFLEKEKARVVDYSIEGDDGVFIYTKSDEWCDDAGSGTFRGDTEGKAIEAFYERVPKAEMVPYR